MRKRIDSRANSLAGRRPARSPRQIPPHPPTTILHPLAATSIAKLSAERRARLMFDRRLRVAARGGSTDHAVCCCRRRCAQHGSHVQARDMFAARERCVHISYISHLVTRHVTSSSHTGPSHDAIPCQRSNSKAVEETTATMPLRLYRAEADATPTPGREGPRLSGRRSTAARRGAFNQ